MSNYVVEDESSNNFGRVVKSRHGFCPLSEVTNDNYDVFVAIDGGRLTVHEVNFPFIEGDNCDDWMEGSKRFSSFGSINLKLAQCLTVMKQSQEKCGTKLTGSNDLLGNGHLKMMPTSSVGMTIIKNLLNLFMGEASTIDSFHSPLV